MDGIQPVVDERIGQFLSSTPPVIENIFRNLGIRDISRCARVCKLWNQIAECVKKQRQDIIWMFQATPLVEELNCEKDKRTSEAGLSSIEDSFYQMMADSFIQPETGIIFGSSSIINYPQKYFKGFTVPEDQQTVYNDKPFLQFLCKRLPRNCSVFSCGAVGVIGPPVGNSTSFDIPMVGFSSCMFPNIPDLKIYQFSFTEENHRDPNQFNASEIAQYTGIAENVNIKALLLFCGGECTEGGVITSSVVDHYMKKQDFQIAFGGAFVDEVVTPKENENASSTIVGLAFSGDNVNAASIVIQGSVQTEIEFKMKLMELKSHIQISKKSIAFMFESFLKDYLDNGFAEDSVFREVFPDTLLFGCYANGEIGFSYLPNMGLLLEKKMKTKDGRRPIWTHLESTVFVIISW